MIVANPSDNGATILVIFDKPYVPQFQIHNLTKMNLEYMKYDCKNRRELRGTELSKWRELETDEK